LSHVHVGYVIEYNEFQPHSAKGYQPPVHEERILEAPTRYVVPLWGQAMNPVIRDSRDQNGQMEILDEACGGLQGPVILRHSSCLSRRGKTCADESSIIYYLGRNETILISFILTTPGI
jgi:hypothetical protein